MASASLKEKGGVINNLLVQAAIVETLREKIVRDVTIMVAELPCRTDCSYGYSRKLLSNKKFGNTGINDWNNCNDNRNLGRRANNTFRANLQISLLRATVKTLQQKTPLEKIQKINGANNFLTTVERTTTAVDLPTSVRGASNEHVKYNLLYPKAESSKNFNHPYHCGMIDIITRS